MDKQGPGSPNTLLGESDVLDNICGATDLVAGRVEPGTAPMKRRSPLETAGMIIDTPAPRMAAVTQSDIDLTLSHTEHYIGCPCGRCQQVRAARTPAPVPLCYFPCCGATVKLVRTIGGGYSVIGKETHNTHCKELAS